MSDLQESIHVNVEYYPGQGEDDIEQLYYVASFVEIAATTDGITLDDLIRNIREVLDLYIETQTPNMDVKLAPNPRVMIISTRTEFGV